MAEQQRAVNPETGEVWILVDGQWVPEPKAERLGPVEGALAQLNQGLLAGYNDEFQAAVRHPVSAVRGALGLGGGEAYREEQQRQERAQREHALRSPGVASTARAVGATVPFAAAAMTGGSSLLPSLSSRAGGFFGGLREATAIGGAAGGVNALGEASAPTSASEALGTAAVGATEGALLGGALHTGLAGASRLLREPARRLEEYVRATVGGRPSAPATGAPGAPPAAPAGSGAQRRALNDLEAAGMTPEGVREGLAAGRSAGVPTSIADVGGIPLQRSLRGARTGDPAAGNLMDTRMNLRAQGQQDRVADALEAGIGVRPVAPGATLEQLAASQRQLAGPLYARARESGRIEDTAILRDLMDGSRVYAPAHEEARRLLAASSKGQPVPPPLYAEQGQLIRTPDIRDIDMIKRGVDARLYNNARGRVEPKDSLDAEAQRNLQLALRNTDPANGPPGLLPMVDQVVPEYGAARAIYAGHSRMRDIVETGQELWRRSPEEIEAYLRSLATDGERELLRGSVLQSLQARLRNAADRADGANVLNEVFGWGHGAKGDKLRLLFPDDRAYAEFRAKAEAELNAVRSRRFIQGGSNTMDKAVDVIGVMGEGADAAMNAATGNKFGMMHSALNMGRRAVNSFSDTSYELADMLTSTQGSQADDFLRALEQLRQERIARMTRRPATNAAALAAGANSPD